MSAELPLTSPDLVALEVPGVVDRDSALEHVLDLMEGAGRLAERGQLRSDLLAREEAGTTALPGGVAIPHARSAGVTVTSVVVVRVRRSIRWSEAAPDVDLVLALLCTAGDRDGYLSLLQAVTKGVVGRLPRNLRAAQSEQDVVSILEGVLPQR